MSKQIYIDSEGNEIKVSGTVNTADMLPMSASDSKKVSEAIGAATSAERLYINTTYQNDVNSNITLSKSIENFRFLRVTVSIGTNDNYNKCHILIPNMKTYLSGVYPLATISGGDKWVRIEMYTPNDTKLYIISSSEASLCIYEVVGVN